MTDDVNTRHHMTDIIELMTNM